MAKEKSNKTKNIQLRLTPEFKEQIRLEAEKRNIAVSDFIKNCVYTHLNKK